MNFNDILLLAAFLLAFASIWVGAFWFASRETKNTGSSSRSSYSPWMGA